MNGIHDSSLVASGGLISADIAARESEFDFALKSYVDKYQIATSDTMGNIRGILLNDAPTTGPGIISDQKQALSSVADTNGLWSQYKGLQEDELNQLQALENSKIADTPVALHNAYERAYLTL